MIVWLHVYSFIAKIDVTFQTARFRLGRSEFTRKPGTSSHNQNEAYCFTSAERFVFVMFSVVVVLNLQGNWFAKLLFQQLFSVFLLLSGQMFPGAVRRRTIIIAQAVFCLIACKQALVSGQSSCFLAFYFGARSSLRTTRVTRGRQGGVSGGGSVLVYPCTRE